MLDSRSMCMLSEQGVQAWKIDRFLQDLVAAGTSSPLAIEIAVCSKAQDRDVLELLKLPHGPGRADPIEHGHCDIHQYKIGFMVKCLLNSVVAVLGLDDFVLIQLKVHCHHVSDVGVVFD